MENQELDIQPVKLQAWTPKWRRDRAEKVARNYGTTVTAMLIEGLDIVIDRLEGRFPSEEKTLEKVG